MSTEEQDAIQTTQIDGDVSVGRNVALGGGFISQGKGRVKGDLVVDGWLDAKNIKGVFKGIYLTVEKLKADFPEPEDGWWAIVGKTIPGPIYAADNGKWVATGEIGGQPTISGDEYYESLFEVLQYLTEEFDAFTATKGMPNGLAPLDSETKIPATYLPSYVDDVIEFAKTVESVTVQPSAIDKSSIDSGCSVIYDKAKNVFVLSVTDSTGTKYYKDWNDSDAFGDESDIGIVPQSGKVYVDNNENKTYRWSGTKLVVIGSDLSLGYTEATAFPGSDGKELQQTVALQEQAITSLTNTINSWDNKILNKLDKSVWDSIFVLHREDEEDPTKITSIEVKANLWTNGEISAGGQREGGGGSAGGLIQTVYRYTQLNITLSDNDKTNTFNAYTIQQLANRIESLESTPSGISSLTINLGTVSYKGVGTTDVVVNLPAYPTTLPASDVYSWAKQPNKPSYTFSEIGSKPSTLSGYGITDAYSKTDADGRYVKKSGDTMTGILTSPGYYGYYLRDESASEFYIGSAENGITGYTGLLLATYGNLPTIISSNGTIRLLVNANGAYWNNQYPLLHTNNYASYLDSRYARTAYDNNLIYHSNEFNFIPSGFSSQIAINYRTQGGLNGNVSEYWFYNGSGQLSDIVASAVTANAIFSTPSIQVYDSMSTLANRLCLNWYSSYARLYAVSNDGGSLRTLWIGSTSAANTLCYDSSTGRWGIGTVSPLQKFHVSGAIGCDDWIYSYGSAGWYNSTYGGGIYMTDSTWVRVYNNKGFRVSNDIYTTTKVIAVQGYQVGTSTDMGWYYYSTAGRIAAGLNTVRGVNVGSLLVSNAWADSTKVPTNGIYCKGNIVATGEVSAGNASDRRLKKDISTLSEGETEHVLSALNPVSFVWNAKAEELSNGRKRGIAYSFVADEFLSLLPNAGRKMWDDYDAIYTEQVVPYVVKGWQMHERRLSDHERRIQELEKENKELKRQLRRVA